ncbi:MAG: dCMP deaminase family protein [Lentisphaeria bacterium]|nr:dCMP deaminase family protein [Lentisphaeria bacterium]
MPNEPRKRPSWDQYFMDIAQMVAARSNCSRRQVAAVLVKDCRIISTGYNGTPRGVRNCSDGGCPRCNSDTPSGHGLHECLCSHAEENSIVQAAYHGIAVKGATLYTTFSPCLQCAKMIINAGIVEVVYHQRYSIDDVSTRLLKEAGVIIRPLKEEEND